MPGQTPQPSQPSGSRRAGWIEGQNLTVEWRYADGHAERLPALAADLVRLPVDVLVTHGLTIRPAQHATQTIPLVMAIVTDPVGSGLVASLPRPGGNLTGLSIGAAELGSKRLELLLQAVPQASRIAVRGCGLGRQVRWQGTQTALGPWACHCAQWRCAGPTTSGARSPRWPERQTRSSPSQTRSP